MHEEKILPEISELITNRNLGKKVWELLVEKKNNYVKKQKEFLDQLENEDNPAMGYDF